MFGILKSLLWKDPLVPEASPSKMLLAAYLEDVGQKHRLAE